MNVASLELSKELYELSGWHNVGAQWARHPGYQTDFNVDTQHSEAQYVSAVEWFPAYDLGYLLRKSEEVTFHVVESCAAIFEPLGRNIAYVAPRDEPENTLAGLYIELFKQGVLTRGGDE